MTSKNTSSCFSPGFSRNAEGVLHDQKARSETDDAEMLENLHVVKRLGIESRQALERGDTQRFAELMLEHWKYKKSRTPGMSNKDIDRWYEAPLMRRDRWQTRRCRWWGIPAFLHFESH